MSDASTLGVIAGALATILSAMVAAGARLWEPYFTNWQAKRFRSEPEPQIDASLNGHARASWIAAVSWVRHRIDWPFTFAIIVTATTVLAAQYTIATTIKNRYKSETRHLVEALRDQIEKVASPGPMTELARDEIKNLVRSAKFADGTGYFFLYADDDQYTCLVHGGDPRRENQAFGGRRGTDRTHLLGLSDAARINSEPGSARNAFLEYAWEKPGSSDKRQYAKIGYALRIKHTNWWLGSGVLVDDVFVSQVLASVWLPVPLLLIVLIYRLRQVKLAREFEHFPIGMIVANRHHDIVRVNHMASLALGRQEPKVLRGQNLQQLLGQENWAAFNQAVKAADGGEAQTFLATLQRLPVEFELVSFKNRQNQIYERIYSLRFDTKPKSCGPAPLNSDRRSVTCGT
jgi:PAS domain-containing protein